MNSPQSQEVSQHERNWLKWLSEGSGLWNSEEKVLYKLTGRFDDNQHSSRFGKHYTFMKTKDGIHHEFSILEEEEITVMLTAGFALKSSEDVQLLNAQLCCENLHEGSFIQTVQSGTVRQIIKILGLKQNPRMKTVVVLGAKMHEEETYDARRLRNGLKNGIVSLLNETQIASLFLTL